jgi:hypothetical protein
LSACTTSVSRQLAGAGLGVGQRRQQRRQLRATCSKAGWARSSEMRRSSPRPDPCSLNRATSGTRLECGGSSRADTCGHFAGRVRAVLQRHRGARRRADSRRDRRSGEPLRRRGRLPENHATRRAARPRVLRLALRRTSLPSPRVAAADARSMLLARSGSAPRRACHCRCRPKREPVDADSRRSLLTPGEFAPLRAPSLGPSLPP